MGLAVVLGQDLAEPAGSVRDGAAADLAAGNRNMGYGHRETAGTGLAHHLHDARPERLTLRAPRGTAAALDRAGPESRRCRAGQFYADRIDLERSQRQMSTFAIRAAMYKYTALVAWPAGL